MLHQLFDFNTVAHLMLYFFGFGFFASQFSRTIAPETSKGPALIGLMRHHKWGKACCSGMWKQACVQASVMVCISDVCINMNGRAIVMFMNMGIET